MDNKLPIPDVPLTPESPIAVPSLSQGSKSTSGVANLSLIETHYSPGAPAIWDVSLRFHSGDHTLIFKRCNFQIQDPYSAKQATNLEWYFEDFLKNSLVEGVRFDAAARSIIDYGESLFNQLFPRQDDWDVCSRFFVEDNPVCISIHGGPAFQSLHWEALRHPSHDTPFSLHVSILRRVDNFGLSFVPEPVTPHIPSSSKLNILLVVARPRGARDVTYRSISRPLVDCLSGPHLNCNVDLVRPGTLSAFERQLKERPKGFYDVVHFDLHGTVTHYDPLLHDHLSPFQGTKSFLIFQRGETSEDWVDAHQIACILTEHCVSAAILNACQSGLETGEPESSLASVLSRSGLSFVLGMCYSITVDAAVSAVAAVYNGFAHGKPWAECVIDARKDLWRNKERTAYYGKKIILEDWLLPVAYINPQKVETSTQSSEKFLPASFVTTNPFVPTSGFRYQGPQLVYDFIGRDINILEIEARLLSNENSNQLIIKGMMGAGKTSLLHHLGEWWQRTGLVESVFYFEYYERAWTVPQILTWIARQFYLPESPDFQKFDMAPLAEQQCAIVEWLQIKRHLIILDNMEAIMMDNSEAKLPYRMRMELVRLLKAFSGIKSIILLGSRNSLEWMHFPSERIYSLGGLDTQEASLLVSRILYKFGKIGYLDDPHIHMLTDRLHESPLALQVVLSSIERKLPREIVHELENGSITLDADEEAAQTGRSLHSCIEYAYSNLRQQDQKLLLCLAPFVSHLVRPHLSGYQMALTDQQILAGCSSVSLQTLIRTIEYSGLISTHPHNRDWLIMQPVLPTFLSDKLHNQPETRASIDEAFCLHYHNEIKRLFSLMHNPHAAERQTAEDLVGFLFENVKHALELRLRGGKPMTVFFEALNVYLRRFSDSHRGIEFSNSMLSLLDELGNERLLSFDVGALYFWAGKWQMWRRNHDSAKQHFLMALEINENSHPLSSRPDSLRYVISSIHESLGEIALNQGRLKESEAGYQQAADNSPMQIPPDELMSMSTVRGRVALMRRDWNAASEHFRNASRISLENQREDHKAIHLFNLGSAELGKRNWAAAKQFYEDALSVCIAHPDKPTEANIHYHLASVFGELGNVVAAHKHYSDALTLYDVLRMPHRQADCYRFLAKLAQKDNNWVQAEAYCGKAIEIAETEKVDKDHAGSAYFALAEVLARQGKRDAAKIQYETAFKFLNPGAEWATTALQLGLLANAGKQYTQAKAYLTESLTWAEKNPGVISPRVMAGIFFELGDAFLQDRPRDLCVGEQRYWQALAIYIDGADHQRREVVETRLKAVISLVSPACKQACDAYDALATDEEKALFAHNHGASTTQADA